MAQLDTGERLSAVVGSAGRRALRELWVLLVVGVVAIAGVAFTVAMHEPPPATHRALEAGAADLAELHQQDVHYTLLFHEWMSHSELMSAEATMAGTGALEARTEAMAIWRRFASRPVTIPGERDLREAYERHDEVADRWEEQLTTEGALEQLAADPAARAANIVASAEQLTDRIDVVDELRLLYDEARSAAADVDRGAADELRSAVTWSVGTGLVTLLIGFVLVARSGWRRARDLSEAETLIEGDTERTRFEAELSRALEMCDDEGAAYRILETAAARVLPDGGAELLVADSSLAHLARSAATDGAVSCQVTSPSECPAIRRGHTQEFPSADALDACPFVRDRAGDGVTTCVPFTVGGSSIGVVHVSSPDVLPAPTVTHVELISRKAGERVGVARAFARTQDQARTDPLTGLLNRRSLEERARDMVESGRPCAVVFADLDHFKTLNDVHGHDAGDRALRLFSRCLREALRPGDAACRYGGEEFVVVLPDCDAVGATAVIDRVRETVERRLDGGTVPRFTASFGIADADGSPLGDVIARSDAALLAAKRAGRNRTVLWNPGLGSGRVEEPADDALEPFEETSAAGSIG